ncbi:MAG: hypothetical protein WC406_09605 [Methanoregula sp.]
MKKTFTVSQNSTLEPIDSHEQKTRFPDIGNIIVAQEADEKYEQTTSFTGIRNIIIAEEADKKYEQTTLIPSIIGMNSQGCIVPCARFFAVACEAVAQLKKNDPIVESTKYFCFWTNIRRDF